jgi:hypothetical protein
VDAVDANGNILDSGTGLVTASNPPAGQPTVIPLVPVTH